MFTTGIGKIELILVIVLGLGLIVYLITLVMRLMKALESIVVMLEK
jgi:hypothetical protein